VEENLLMGLSRFPGSEAKEVPAFIYELFPVLLQMKQRRGGDLSGGQQQQLAIGRALASRPRLLILDEPTEGIQPSVIKEIGAVIKKLAARGDMAILLVEQFYDFAAELADQYLVMSRGEIVQQGRGENMEAEGVRGLVPSNLICSFLTIITHHESTRLALFTPSWHAELELAYARFGDCTRPVQRRHLGPLRVQKHLYAEGPRSASTSSSTRRADRRR
jgi:energy-coupling factor transporter ATP-binding protein EcfA2